MKKSKIVLGLTSFILAIAGVAATKASSRALSSYYLETTAGSGKCALVSVSPGICTTGKSIACTTAAQHRGMYLTVTSTNFTSCKTQLSHD